MSFLLGFPIFRGYVKLRGGKGLIRRIIKGNQWFISTDHKDGYFCGVPQRGLVSHKCAEGSQLVVKLQPLVMS